MSQGLVRERPGTKAGTEAARAAFLYGEGDGVRVVDRKRLAEIGGISSKTLHNHLPAWEKEFLMIAADRPEKGFSLFLSSDDIRTHQRNIQDFKQLEAQMSQEITDLPKLEKYLRGLIDWFKEHGTNGDVADMRDTINSFLRVAASRKSIIKQRLEVNARWNKLTGIEDLIDAAGAREKAMQTGRAKLDLEKERRDAGFEGNGEPVKVMPVGRQYKRKDAIPAEEVDDGFGDCGKDVET